jgi:UDP-3-O-[3-hydroxymyristoyl] glucosamine N-acyltransferase
MHHTLGELARLVGGTVVGDETVTVTGATPLAAAAAGHLTLLDAPERVKKLVGSLATAVVAPSGVEVPLPAIVVADVHAAFAAIVAFFRPPVPARRIGRSPSAVISPSATLADDVDVHPFAVIGDDVEIGPGTTIHAGVSILAGSKIGADVVIFPNAVLYENTVVGPRSIIHSGAVLGAYGFGYKTVGGRHVLSAQLGYVEIGADVEIGAGTTIDRGTYGPTRIGDGTKIDDQVMIGHNCLVGRHNILCGQVGIAGSTTTGEYVVMGGQAGVRDHVHIGDGAAIGAKTGVLNDVAAGLRIFGIPGIPERDQLLQMASASKLPEMRKQLRELQRALAELQSLLSAGDKGQRTAA